MDRKEAKELFKNDKNAYGCYKSVMKKIDLIFDAFEKKLKKKDVVWVDNEFVVTRFIYKDDFYFHRLQHDKTWYVTYQNEIINRGMYRHDLMGWIDTTYFTLT